MMHASVGTGAGASVPPAAEDSLGAGPAQRRCGNCGTPLLGEHCHACGQPTKGLVRHFTSIVGDFVDSVFDFDARTWRTLGPLLFRPGYLTLEYFAGRRVRYVTPVRLFFFLCVLAFLALQLTVDMEGTRVSIDPGAGVRMGESEFAAARTVEEVERHRDAALAELVQARGEVQLPGVGAALDAAAAAIAQQADTRIAELRAQAADRQGAPAPEGQRSSSEDGAARPAALSAEEPARGADGRAMPAEAARERKFSFDVRGAPWHPTDNPVRLESLPAFANEAVNRLILRAEANALRFEDEPQLLAHAVLENLPLTLFLMLPVFALLLKLSYLFTRRLYMEHLIVALHSHAFLCAGLLLVAGCVGLRGAFDGGAAASVVGWIQAAVVLWMPLYLLIMQRRVYGQHWLLTLLKFGFLGVAYLLLLTGGTVFALMLSLVRA